jgi:hypothetical protein
VGIAGTLLGQQYNQLNNWVDGWDEDLDGGKLARVEEPEGESDGLESGGEANSCRCVEPVLCSETIVQFKGRRSLRGYSVLSTQWSASKPAMGTRERTENFRVLDDII